jgi:hypothetical protein
MLGLLFSSWAGRLCSATASGAPNPFDAAERRTTESSSTAVPGLFASSVQSIQ